MSKEHSASAGDYPIRFKEKPPGATLDYALDFTDMALDYAPATLLAVAWSVVANAGDASPLAIVAQSLALNVSTVRLAAGVPLESYSVRCQCSWSDGQTSVVAFTLSIAFNPNLAQLFPAGISGAELFGIPNVH